MVKSEQKSGTWLTYAGDEPRALEIRQCRLTVVGGPQSGLSVDLHSARIRVGSRQGCDLVVEDPSVSGYHFEILLEADGYRISDLDSTNGTFINGVRIRSAYVQPEQSIKIGGSILTFKPLEASTSVQLSPAQHFGDMVGRSPSMRVLFARLEKAARTDASVMVFGETGVGKELVARGIHDASARASGPFVVVDCGSIPSGLIASELFGHEKGAFTGAHTRYSGAFERAHGGTIFLDELGELPAELQASLLGALERRQIRRVGGKSVVDVDVRVVAATNRDLVRDINKGRFRDDLYYRIAVVTVEVPPLRERVEDIPLLVEHFLDQLPGGDDVTLSRETMDSLMAHEYPGNIRELRNLIERAAIFPDDSDLLPARVSPASGSSNVPSSAPDADMSVQIDTKTPFKRAKADMVGEFERRFIGRLLEEHGGNVSAAARFTGLDRMTVYKMAQKHGLGES